MQTNRAGLWITIPRQITVGTITEPLPMERSTEGMETQEQSPLPSVVLPASIYFNAGKIEGLTPKQIWFPR